MSGLYLCRHAESIANVEGWISGWRDVPLSEQGSRQAHQLADALQQVETCGGILTSDLARARETGRIVADRLQLELIEDRDLRERDYGEWTGRQLLEVRKQHAREFNYMLADPGYAPPGGESLVQHRDRVVRALKRTSERWSGGFILVAHWGTIWVTLTSMFKPADPGMPRPVGPPGFVRLDANYLTKLREA